MVSVAVPTAISAKTAPGRRYDHLFFSAMAALILLSVFIGFSPTYFLAGVFRAPLPAPIIHFHGAAFSCWVLLLVVQTSLVSAHRVDIHRRLGIFGFCLAALMVVLGVLAATNLLVRNAGRGGLDPKEFYIVPMGDMLIFAILIFFAYRSRKNPAAHKRLILIATVSLLTAAFARFHVGFLFRQITHAMLASYAFLLLLAIYDLWSTHKIQRVTLFGSTILIVAQFVRFPVSHTAAWHAFATWVQSLGH
jgi:FtsH-binding integral membrane protein